MYRKNWLFWSVLGGGAGLLLFEVFVGLFSVLTGQTIGAFLTPTEAVAVSLFFLSALTCVSVVFFVSNLGVLLSFAVRWLKLDDGKFGSAIHAVASSLDLYSSAPAVKLDQRIRRAGRWTVDRLRPRQDLHRQIGAMGNVAQAARRARQATGRQSGRRGAAKRPAAKAGKSDSDGDGEPPRPHSCSSLEQFLHWAASLVFSYDSAAQLLDCSPKTLRNKVTLGLLPAPLQTLVGPRFTGDQLAQILFPLEALPTAPRRGRGRPRIVANGGTGGQP